MTDLDTYNVILGKLWHKRFTLYIDYSNNICYINQRGKTLTFHKHSQLDHSPKLCSLIQTKDLKYELVNTDSLYLYIVQSTSIPPKPENINLEESVQKVLKEFADIFTSLPNHLPPCRTYDYSIKLIKGTKLSYKLTY